MVAKNPRNRLATDHINLVVSRSFDWRISSNCRLLNGPIPGVSIRAILNRLRRSTRTNRRRRCPGWLLRRLQTSIVPHDRIPIKRRQPSFVYSARHRGDECAAAATLLVTCSIDRAVRSTAVDDFKPGSVELLLFRCSDITAGCCHSS